MPKITIIGAGSAGFTRRLVTDVLSFPELSDSTISLMDINKTRLGYAKKSVEKIVAAGNYPAKVTASLDRAEALKGADIVITTILVGGYAHFRPEIEIPMKYGVSACVGDSMSISGIFRTARTAPVMIDICRDIEKHAPNAFLLNYTNPMAMLCRAMQKATSVRLVGLCHSVQGIAEMLAHWIGAPIKEINYVCAGINHQAWFVRYEWRGKDAYPLVREAVKKKENYEHEIVLNEMFLHLDYYVTESSGHNSEYNWWFRKRPDLIEKYCNRGTGWNPGKHGIILEHYKHGDRNYVKHIKQWLAQEKIDLNRSHEYASYIIRGLTGIEPFKFNGTVPNTGIITNLPPDAAVEVPVLADRNGFNPIYVGALPPQCAALNNAQIACHEMAVEALLKGDKRMLLHACLYDPLCAAVCSMEEIERMFNELFRVQQKRMPTFQ